MSDENSVIDEFEAVLQRREAALSSTETEVMERYDAAVKAADAEHDAATTAACDERDQALLPIDAEQAKLDSLRVAVEGLREQSSEPVPDPSVPSVPASDSSSPDSASTDPESASASPEPSTPPAEVSTASPVDASGLALTDPTSEPEPSTPSSDASPLPLPTDSPEAVEDTLRGVDTTQPVAVPLSTGEVKVVTAADVIAARDATIADDDLTDDQKVLRNSDLP